jgi:hypothetical protein
METKLLFKSGRVQKFLLICGIISSLFYVFEDMLAASLWQGYSMTAQAFSDYSAVDAPTRQLILFLSPIYSALVIAFGLGITGSNNQKRGIRVIGVLLVVYALISWIWPQFYPVHLYVSEATSSDFMHIVLTFITVFSWLIMLILGAVSFGKAFRIYSIGTFLAIILFGSLTGYFIGTSQSELALNVQGLGITERMLLYSFMIWVAVLSAKLLQLSSFRIKN